MLDCFYQGEKYHIIHVYTAPEARKKSQLFNRLGELLTVGFNLILSGDLIQLCLIVFDCISMLKFL